MPILYGYDEVMFYPLLNDIRLVTQLANATAAEFRQKSADVGLSTLRSGMNPNCRNTCTETINAHATREHSLFRSGLYYEISDVPAYMNK